MLEVSLQSPECQESKTTRGSRELFLKAVSVWINKPHVVNRRLCGSTILHVRRCQTKNEAEQALVESRKLFDENYKKDAKTVWEAGQLFKDLSEEKNPFCVIFRELVPKSQYFPRLQETIVYDKEEASVTFFPANGGSGDRQEKKVLSTKEVTYTIRFKEIDAEMPVWAQLNEVTIAWSDETKSDTSRCQLRSQWLRSVLLDKLVSWSQVNDISTSATSLMLVAVDKYKDTYVRLKNTYGRDLVENWPEKTDPKKFVYEDVAIAAYLLLIWEEDRLKKGLKEKQSFVDLGCGNGLLVYILSREGHKGLGIDLRRRKIWDMFEKDVDLKEEAIKPSSEHLFPDYDWLIGNHSDELTPWIPVMAARSSPTCSFFVLPCCPHDFVGKFSDTKKGQSRYGTYIDYVKEIVEHCGFCPEIDTLRIPSTKRICLIGRQRTYRPEDESLADSRCQDFIDKRTLLKQGKQHQQIKVDSSVLEEKLLSPLGSQGTTDSQTFDWLNVLGKVSVRLDRLDSGYFSTGLPSLPTTPPVSQQNVGHLSDEGKLSNQVIETNRSETSRDKDVTSLCVTVNTDVHLPVRKKIRIESHPDTKTELYSFHNDSKMDVAEERKWASGFQPRVEPGVRNCQSVPEEIKLKIVNSVFDLVMKSDPEENTAAQPTQGGKHWRKGGSASLSDVAAQFDQLTLRQLKAECGGLQTLLRNHSHIFQVSGGRVRLRDFSQADPWKGSNPHKRQLNKVRAEQRDTRKTMLCWFYEHHPDGCPRTNSDCSFAHGKTELRDKSVRISAVV
ncbi:tRNA (uracil-O(2)-)-methyltransferase [Elysia marginata]|uniref:tRNA (uracil-O(2)-)-methyltransferase n=1 Tax=Elysia marginata TaxID=1093978 RepID=A0AAV4JP51_9GAST|nr:tRNA (uracil-O(2)-)-methyltransferase [Elysia marginata]